MQKYRPLQGGICLDNGVGKKEIIGIEMGGYA
jgi:hypothetical protein